MFSFHGTKQVLVPPRADLGRQDEKGLNMDCTNWVRWPHHSVRAGGGEVLHAGLCTLGNNRTKVPL